MALMMITYDLRQPGRNYEPVTKYLESQGAHWHALGSVWFVVTSKTHATIRDELKALTDPNDRFIVINVSNDAAAWKGFSSNADQWLLNEITRR